MYLCAITDRYRVSLAALRELADQGIAAGVYTQTTDVEGEVRSVLRIIGVCFQYCYFHLLRIQHI